MTTVTIDDELIMLKGQLTTSLDGTDLDGTDKLRELVLYVCTASEADEAFGSIKLNKLLFYSDFLTYLQYGTPITGQEYQKLEHGPAPRVMLPLLRDMQAAQQLAIADRSFFGKPQKKPVALREADLTRFSAQEIAVVDHVLRTFHKHNGMEISELSHTLPGWQLAEEGETIPYSSALLRRGELTTRERRWVQELDMTNVEELLCA